MCPAVQVNEVMTLEPESFDLDLTDGSDTALITPPCAHSGYGPVNVRLLSSEHRVGQVGDRDLPSYMKESENTLFHF